MKFLCFLLLFFICSCKNDKASNELILRNGYNYEIIKDIDGDQPKVGQVVSIDFDIIDDFGNVLSDSRKANVKPTVQIPEQMNFKMKRNPLLSLIEVLSPGDSAIVTVPVDSLNSPPSEFLQSEKVRYVVVVHAIESQDDYMARIGGELQQIQTESYEEAKQAFDLYQEGKFNNQIIEKNGGVKLVILEEKNGIKAEFNELSMVHYYGFFKNGKSFDNSYKLNKPYGMRIGKGGVIRGWEIAIPEISEGSSAIIEVPYQMAYGIEGKGSSIPPRSDLIFWVKIDKIEKSKKIDNQ